jgi:hypothetical protein
MTHGCNSLGILSHAQDPNGSQSALLTGYGRPLKHLHSLP